MSMNLAAIFPKARLDAMIEVSRTWTGKLDKAPAWDFTVNTHIDANEAFFVARELEIMRPGVYDVQYPENKAQRLIPWNTSEDPGAESMSIMIGDYAGKPKTSADYASDTPTVSVSTKQANKNFYGIRLGYAYSFQEARASLFARRSLPVAKALACRQSMERELDIIAFQGESSTGITGLLNQTGTANYAVPADGTGGAKTADSKDSDQVLRDLNGTPNGIYAGSNEIEIPNAMVVATSFNNLINSRRVGDGTSQTIKRYYLESQDFIKSIETSYRLEASNAAAWGGTGRRIVTYRKDPAKLEMMVPQPFEQLTPIAQGFMVLTLCHMRTGGLFLYAPNSMGYADGL